MVRPEGKAKPRKIPRFLPGPWRDYVDDSLPRLPEEARKQFRAKKPRGSTCKGHFFKPGQAFSPLPYCMLDSDAWRDMSAMASMILLDMIHAFNGQTYSDNKPLPSGMKYTYSQCRVCCSERAFIDARASIVRIGWFQTPHALQDNGHCAFVPGGWREYKAPPSASFRKKQSVKVEYVIRQSSRQMKKGTCRNWSGAGAKTGVTPKLENEEDGAKTGVVIDIYQARTSQMYTRRTFHLFCPEFLPISRLRMLRRPTLVGKGLPFRGLAITSPDDSLAAIYDYAFGP